MIVVIGTERRAAIQHASNEANNLSAAFQEEISKTLNSVTLAMEAVAERMRAAHGQFDIYDWAKEIPLLAASTVQGGIIAPDGMILSSTFDPHPPPTDLSDREHFRAHLNGDFKGVYISKPMVGRVTGQTVDPDVATGGCAGWRIPGRHRVLAVTPAVGDAARCDRSQPARQAGSGRHDRPDHRACFGAGTENGDARRRQGDAGAAANRPRWPPARAVLSPEQRARSRDKVAQRPGTSTASRCGSMSRSI